MKLKEIKKLLVDATPGPWRLEDGTSLVWGNCDPDEDSNYGLGKPVAKAIFESSFRRHELLWDETTANARLIAAAPTVIRDLVEQNKRMRKALESVEWISDDDGYYSCPECHKFEHYGHAENCLIATALKESA